MTKIIRIRTCFDCTHLEMHSDSDVCMMLNRMLDTKKIPSWCPLEDAPDTGELASNCVECSGPNGFHYALCSKSDTGEEG